MKPNPRPSPARDQRQRTPLDNDNGIKSYTSDTLRPTPPPKLAPPSPSFNPLLAPSPSKQFSGPLPPLPVPMHRRLRSSFDKERGAEASTAPPPSSFTTRPPKLGPFKDTRAILSSPFKGQTIGQDGRRPDVSSRTSSLPPIVAGEASEETTPTLLSDQSTANHEDFPNLFTPTSHPPYSPSVTSTQSSGSKNRERVLGLKPAESFGTSHPGGSKLFLPPNMADILPFAADHRFAAWDPNPNVHKAHERSMSSANTLSTSDASATGWNESPRKRGSIGRKRVWKDDQMSNSVYKIGWERDVLDLEARLHETMWEVAGEGHTFTRFGQGEEPKAVLDLGTGLGLWPISQALEWPDAEFVGVDLVPCQVDLSLLAEAERKARSTSAGHATGTGIWGSVEKRITWEKCDCTALPYDTGVFDFVHIRFVGLGIPESKWGDLLEEAARVLRKGGTLEIVEMSYSLPPSKPLSLVNSFASLLLADLVAPDPSLPIRFYLPTASSLAYSQPIFDKTWQNPPGALNEALMTFVKSALDYKGTSLSKSGDTQERLISELRSADPEQWKESVGDATSNTVTVWAWSVKRT